MKNKVFLWALLSLGVLAFAGKPATLLPAAEGDLSSDQVVKTALSAMLKNVDRNPVSMSWAVENGANLNLAQTPHAANSREYRLVVQARDFNEGISLPLTQSGALVRLNPVNQKGGDSLQAAIDPVDLVLVNQEGRSFSAGSAMEELVSAERLAAADGNIFSPGTSAFRTSETLGSGDILLFADNMDYASNQAYVIHVFEKESDVVFNLQTQQDTYMAGQTPQVAFSMTKAGAPLTMETISGRFISPEGIGYPIQIGSNGELRGLPSAISSGEGLWQIELSAEVNQRGLIARRDVRTAFSYVLPTARFNGSVDIEQTRQGLTANLSIEVGSPGRFEVRGILFGMNQDGAQQAIAISHSAGWLEAGNGSLPLSFDAQLIQKSGLQAPFSVGDLRLIQQDRMSLLHRQQNGFIIP